MFIWKIRFTLATRRSTINYGPIFRMRRSRDTLCNTSDVNCTPHALYRDERVTRKWYGRTMRRSFRNSRYFAIWHRRIRKSLLIYRAHPHDVTFAAAYTWASWIINYIRSLYILNSARFSYYLWTSDVTKLVYYSYALDPRTIAFKISEIIMIHSWFIHEIARWNNL